MHPGNGKWPLWKAGRAAARDGAIYYGDKRNIPESTKKQSFPDISAWNGGRREEGQRSMNVAMTASQKFTATCDDNSLQFVLKIFN